MKTYFFNFKNRAFYKNIYIISTYIYDDLKYLIQEADFSTIKLFARMKTYF